MLASDGSCHCSFLEWSSHDKVVRFDMWVTSKFRVSTSLSAAGKSVFAFSYLCITLDTAFRGKNDIVNSNAMANRKS